MTATLTLRLSADRTAFVVDLPSGASGRPHQVRLPITVNSSCGCKHEVPYTDHMIPCQNPEHRLEVKNKTVQALVDILTANERTAGLPATLGTPAAPVQDMIDAFLRDGNRIEDEGVRAERLFEEKWGSDALEFGKSLKLDI